MSPFIHSLTRTAAATFSFMLIGSAAAASDKQPGLIADPNKVPIKVDHGMRDIVNIPTVSVTVCVPGRAAPSDCQTIDNVLVDTGSVGLRLIKSALSTVADRLPQLKVNRSRLMACGQFVSGYTYGWARLANVKIGGETAHNIPIQLIDDSGSVPVPSTCSSVGPPFNTVDELHANGILGVGVTEADCGAKCVLNEIPGYYYVCRGNICDSTKAFITQQIANPVARFTALPDNHGIADNNGVIVQLPPVDSNGAPSVTGALIFGIDTRSNLGMLDRYC